MVVPIDGEEGTEVDLSSGELFRAIQCQEDVFEISCPDDYLIDVMDSNYGRTDKDVCTVREGPRQWRNENCFGVNREPIDER